MLDFLEILSDVIGTMELKEGYNSLEEQEFFEWHHVEWDRVHSDASMSEEERKNRLQEIGDIFVLSTLYRIKKDDRVATAEHVGNRYTKRIQDGKNFYNVKPLHWDSYTNK